jgi:hypothetical protein
MKNFLFGIFFAGLCCGAQALTIDFDDLIEPGTYGPDTAMGFTTSGFVFNETMDVIDISPSGDWWSDGVGSGHSGLFAAVNNYGGDFLMTKSDGGSFSVIDLWLNGWQGQSTSSQISGYFNGVLVASLFAEYSSPWENVVLDFNNIDALLISGGEFLVDDINIKSSAVPESSSIVLMLFGLFCVAYMRQVKKVN